MPGQIDTAPGIGMVRETLATSHGPDWLVHFSFFGAWPVPT